MQFKLVSFKTTTYKIEANRQIIFQFSSVESLQSCPTHCNPMDCSPPGSFVHGISQAGTLE